jgi:hypothetical protein
VTARRVPFEDRSSKASSLLANTVIFQTRRAIRGDLFMSIR